MKERRGWLLQSYPEASSGGLSIWFIDEQGKRHKFHLDMRVRFYAAGPFYQLRQLWKFLQRESICLSLARKKQTDLFQGSIDVMAITTDIACQQKLVRLALNEFPDLDYYNADILPSLYLTAQWGAFPLAYCRIGTIAENVVNIEVLDDPWVIEYDLPPLRILYIEPECDPFHRTPLYITIKTHRTYQIDVSPIATLLTRIDAILNRFDPDIIVSAYGDAWLFPLLLDYCQACQITYFNLCRDEGKPPIRKEPVSYHSYGQIMHRDTQTYLFGRIHVDAKNLTQIYESGLVGIFEQSRLTGMLLQDGARRSPGAGFSAMQVINALREQVLIPLRKAQAERPKSALQLLRADQGGLIGQPKLGVHYGAIEFDFTSMYPAIITRFNISPETVYKTGEETSFVPQLGYSIDMSNYGLIPKTLAPLVKKRIGLKTLLANMDIRDSRYQTLKQKNNAQKSLQTVAFGYMGHKHFKFTQIEVHESITAYSREAMLLTKEILEDAGYETIHLYVDGIYFKRDHPSTESELQQLLDKIEAVTSLPIGNEGVYKWIIFLPSREDPKASVPNRYFGVFKNGEIKIRGIEARTRDTPPFIKEAQMAVIEAMATIPFGQRLETCLPKAIGIFKSYIDRLKKKEVKVDDLIITQVLTREVDAYKVNTRVAKAARQLQNAKKSLHKGMRIRYLLSCDEVGVLAWDSGQHITINLIHISLYIDRLISAGHTIFQSFGITEKELRDYTLNETLQLPLQFGPCQQTGLQTFVI